MIFWYMCFIIYIFVNTFDMDSAKVFLRTQKIQNLVYQMIWEKKRLYNPGLEVSIKIKYSFLKTQVFKIRNL